MSKTNEIDSIIIEDIGQFKTPSLSEIKINSIGQIRALLKDIKRLRYGPKVNIFGNEMTVEFKAGFSYSESTYSEQLYFNFGKNRYEDISNLFNKFEGKSKDTNLLHANAMIEVITKYKHAAITKVEYSLQEQYEKTPAQDVTQLEKYRDQLYSNLEKDLVDYDLVLEDNFNNLLGVDARKALDDNIVKLLKERLMSIWLIGESFRYPPMIIYSLILLQLLQNGYIQASKINSMHPANREGSHKTLINCYKLASGDTVAILTPQEAKNTSEIANKCFEIVKHLYHSIYSMLKCAPREKAKLAKIILEGYINYYMKLCGFTKSYEKFDGLLNHL